MEIGRSRPRDAGDAVDLLLECHERIRRFLGVARRLAGAAGAPEREVVEAAAAVRRYFAEALPLHAEDEERSLLPRLQGRDPALDAALATMAAEHAEHAPALGRLLAACRALEAGEGPAALAGRELEGAVAELDRHFERHLAAEEAWVFPAARRHLDAAEDAALVAEIRARRVVRPGAG